MWRWCRSSIGKKVLMAASGLVLTGFVIAHLAGNLLIYAGQDAINAYAQKLRDWWALLWSVRIGLAAAAGVHVWASVQLALENRRARPTRYHAYQTRRTTLAARTMMLSGCLLLAYIVYHLLHVTFGLAHPELSHAVDRLGRPDVYSMMVASFQHPAISAAYVLGVAVVCLHVSHGIGSTAQTLGAATERTLPIISRVGRLLAIALFLGYNSIPLAVLLGWVRPPP
jgi:succinate dehydrogenase / fumarate reductase cytochrome b subunit